MPDREAPRSPMAHSTLGDLWAAERQLADVLERGTPWLRSQHKPWAPETHAEFLERIGPLDQPLPPGASMPDRIYAPGADLVNQNPDAPVWRIEPPDHGGPHE
jgi:hypothetical protein